MWQLSFFLISRICTVFIVRFSQSDVWTTSKRLAIERELQTKYNIAQRFSHFTDEGWRHLYLNFVSNSINIGSGTQRKNGQIDFIHTSDRHHRSEQIARHWCGNVMLYYSGDGWSGFFFPSASEMNRIRAVLEFREMIWCFGFALFIFSIK